MEPYEVPLPLVDCGFSRFGAVFDGRAEEEPGFELEKVPEEEAPGG